MVCRRTVALHAVHAAMGGRGRKGAFNLRRTLFHDATGFDRDSKLGQKWFAPPRGDLAYWQMNRDYNGGEGVGMGLVSAADGSVGTAVGFVGGGMGSVSVADSACLHDRRPPLPPLFTAAEPPPPSATASLPLEVGYPSPVSPVHFCFVLHRRCFVFAVHRRSARPRAAAAYRRRASATAYRRRLPSLSVF